MRCSFLLLAITVDDDSLPIDAGACSLPLSREASAASLRAHWDASLQAIATAVSQCHQRVQLLPSPSRFSLLASRGDVDESRRIGHLSANAVTHVCVCIADTDVHLIKPSIRT
jgi:hypothetical protein